MLKKIHHFADASLTKLTYEKKVFLGYSASLDEVIAQSDHYKSSLESLVLLFGVLGDVCQDTST